MDDQRGQSPVYAPDYDLLGRLLTIPLAAGRASESGRFARGIDAWLAHELRRAGFGADEVWPRPRTLPQDLAILDTFPAKLATDLKEHIRNMPAVAPTDAKVLGRAYDKQVDVTVARWERAPEVLLSTKARGMELAAPPPRRLRTTWARSST